MQARFVVSLTAILALTALSACGEETVKEPATPGDETTATAPADSAAPADESASETAVVPADEEAAPPADAESPQQ